VADEPDNPFTTPSYVIHLDDSGITVAISESDSGANGNARTESDSGTNA
jgi:hypothetical protein